jgi:uncharacterized membrane protein YciS (DUF1049 family)
VRTLIAWIVTLLYSALALYVLAIILSNRESVSIDLLLIPTQEFALYGILSLSFGAGLLLGLGYALRIQLRGWAQCRKLKKQIHSLTPSEPSA